ncbi:hypothetical protein GPALN_013183 [Globodera pallida]|nr:hypothetical protein GPALN_013183 [Globodera pallida]
MRCGSPRRWWKITYAAEPGRRSPADEFLLETDVFEHAGETLVRLLEVLNARATVPGQEGIDIERARKIIIHIGDDDVFEVTGYDEIGRQPIPLDVALPPNPMFIRYSPISEDEPIAPRASAEPNLTTVPAPECAAQPELETEPSTSALAPMLGPFLENLQTLPQKSGRGNELKNHVRLVFRNADPTIRDPIRDLLVSEAMCSAASTSSAGSGGKTNDRDKMKSCTSRSPSSVSPQSTATATPQSPS